MKDDLVYLKHIREAIEKINSYLEGVKLEDFLESDLVLDAVVRELEIIGEAAKNVSAGFKKKNPSVPWSEMMSMRNRLIHEYFGVNKEIVWDTCQTDLKELSLKLESLRNNS